MEYEELKALPPNVRGTLNGGLKAIRSIMDSYGMMFDVESVRGIVAGTRNQTRRIAARINRFATLVIEKDVDAAYPAEPEEGKAPIRGRHFAVRGPITLGKPKECELHTIESRWRVGDHLWVKEPWHTLPEWDALRPIAFPVPADRLTRERDRFISYDADDAPRLLGKPRHALYMPKWASRILLEIVGVRAERLQAISEEDAIGEGIALHPDFPPVIGFQHRWERHHGRGSWAKNPWVWRIQFVLLDRNAHLAA